MAHHYCLKNVKHFPWFLYINVPQTSKGIITQDKITGLYVCLNSLALDMNEKKQLLNMASENLQPFISPIFPSTSHPDQLVSTTIAVRINQKVWTKMFYLGDNTFCHMVWGKPGLYLLFFPFSPLNFSICFSP